MIIKLWRMDSKYRKSFYREVWPENDCFGRADITQEEEFLALREIFVADLGGE